MSMICLQFGQCGNQLGSKFIDTIYKNNLERDNWFISTNKENIARCVLVDTETKVIPGLLNNNNQWNYRKENVVMMPGGSGNNWALGYYINGPKLADDIFEKLRKECELSDHVRGIVSFLSTGGGTGSGVGTYIIEKLQDNFSNKYILSNLVFPIIFGGNPVHLYNTILSLSQLNDSCDALITFYNDLIFKQCAYLYKDSEFKFTEMNSIISMQLSSLFNSYESTSFIPHHIQRIIPFADYKLLSLKSYPYVKENIKSFEAIVPWESIIERLKSMLINNNENSWSNKSGKNEFLFRKDKTLNYYKGVANVIMCNGKNSSIGCRFANNCFLDDALYSSWTYKSDRFTYLYNNSPLFGQQQFATLISNSTVFNSRLDSIAENAWKFYTKNAYCHHFEKYGLEKNKLKLGFLKVENIIKQYKSL